MAIVEVCASSVQSALVAEKCGADRIELCCNIKQGGVTPSFSAIETVVSKVDIPVHVLLRPRPGDFLYDDLDFHLIKRDAEISAQLGCKGFVFGFLDKFGCVDVERCNIILDIAHQFNLSTTFHRAFDHCSDQEVALEQLISLGFDRILTSGGYPSAIDGVDQIRKLVYLSNNRIGIIAGSGINPNNVANLVKNTNVKEIHGTFSSDFPSNILYANPLFDEDFSDISADEETIKHVISISKNM